jgi:hypothetical protein
MERAAPLTGHAGQPMIAFSFKKARKDRQRTRGMDSDRRAAK